MTKSSAYRVGYVLGVVGFYAALAALAVHCLAGCIPDTDDLADCMHECSVGLFECFRDACPAGCMFDEATLDVLARCAEAVHDCDAECIRDMQ